MCSLRLLSTELHQACQTLLHSRMFRFLRSEKSAENPEFSGKPKTYKLKTEEGRLGRKRFCQDMAGILHVEKVLIYPSLKLTDRWPYPPKRKVVSQPPFLGAEATSIFREEKVVIPVSCRPKKTSDRPGTKERVSRFHLFHVLSNRHQFLHLLDRPFEPRKKKKNGVPDAFP